MSPETCPNCGADVPRNATACLECGSDERTGWSEKAHAENLGLPDDEFNYDEFVKEEFGPGRAKPRGIDWFWWVVAVALVAALVWFLIPHRS